MTHKSKEIEVTSASLLESLKRIIPLDTEEISRAMRLFMDSKELRVYDLAVFYHQEMLKSQKSEAYLAACLMCGAMNEALLTLTCLRNASDVSKTNQFASSTKKRSKAFSDVVAGWSLDQLINVAEELNWVPADVVDEGIKTALAEAYREVAPINHPEMSPEEIESGAQSIFRFPGTSLFRLTQDLRNLIHAGKWLRGRRTFSPEPFIEWCKLGTVLGVEVGMCLLYRTVEREANPAIQKLSELSTMLDALPAELRNVFLEQFRAKL